MMVELLLVAAFAGVTTFDTVHAFQWMISRPIVSGSAAGFLAGDLECGMLAGACIELIWLGVLPIGNYTPPDAHIAAVTSALSATIFRGGNFSLSACVVIAVLLCVPVGIISKKADFAIRGWLAARAEELIAAGPPYRLAGLTTVVSIVTFAKAAVIVMITGIVSYLLAPIVAVIVSDEAMIRALEFSASFVPALGLVQLARCIGARRRDRYLAFGAAMVLVACVLLVYAV